MLDRNHIHNSLRKKRLGVLIRLVLGPLGHGSPRRPRGEPSWTFLQWEYMSYLPRRVQSAQLQDMQGFRIGKRNYGRGWIPCAWVLGPLGFHVEDSRAIARMDIGVYMYKYSITVLKWDPCRVALPEVSYTSKQYKYHFSPVYQGQTDITELILWQAPSSGHLFKKVWLMWFAFCPKP